MRFISTRGQTPPIDFAAAVAQGLAPDRGLYLPEELPTLSPHLAKWASLPYDQLEAAFFQLFTPDWDPARWTLHTSQAVARFSHPEIAPLVQLDQGLYVLELFHGPTLAFKDFALQLLGSLYEEQIARTGEALTILGATSGDTGAAAISGLMGRAGVRVFILYPDGRVSPLQERQMACTGAENIFALAVEGTFDHAQDIVKTLLGDPAHRAQWRLSAVNSINLARVLAQSVYYLYASFQLPPAMRDQARFIVPTGNFGNVLAGWLARQMGMPAEGFTVATNRNDILHRLFTSGTYQLGDVEASHAPSMDIQVASNFERFLYFHENRNPARVRDIMTTFRATGTHHFGDLRAEGFHATRTSDAEIVERIAQVHQRYGYLCDPHTACGFTGLLTPQAEDQRRAGHAHIVLATAHPAKFPDVVQQATGLHPTHPTLEALKDLPLAKHQLPATEEAVTRFLEAKA